MLYLSNFRLKIYLNEEIAVQFQSPEKKNCKLIIFYFYKKKLFLNIF